MKHVPRVSELKYKHDFIHVDAWKPILNKLYLVPLNLEAFDSKSEAANFLIWFPIRISDILIELSFVIKSRFFHRPRHL